MSSEFKNRIITSIALIFLLFLMYLYSYILISAVIIIALIAWFEFYMLITKIYKRNNKKDFTLRLFYKSFSLLYLLLLTFIIIYSEAYQYDFRSIILYSLFISICSDLGGFIFGKLFKGAKLTKISPNKTISGSIGAFLFSLMVIPFFNNHLDNYGFFLLLIITLLISLASQFGDLLISIFKRKANSKNTSDLLPGHGGVLDRIDGIIFAIPAGFLLFNLLR